MQGPADTRERIVQAARELFHERGYTAVGVADICAQAGVVKGSFYHFFPTKDELLAETVQRNWGQLQELLQSLEQADSSGRAAIGQLFDIIGQEARKSHRECGRVLGCRLGSIASELGAADPAGAEKSRRAFEGWRRSLRRLVKRGQADGSIDPGIDATSAADGLLASIQGMSVLGRTLHQPALLKRVASVAMQQVPAP